MFLLFFGIWPTSNQGRSNRKASIVFELPILFQLLSLINHCFVCIPRGWFHGDEFIHVCLWVLSVLTLLSSVCLFSWSSSFLWTSLLFIHDKKYSITLSYSFSPFRHFPSPSLFPFDFRILENIPTYAHIVDKHTNM